MGRPPCCDKVGVKKGPWTPEEDIMLVSYVQEHGPGNWRSVPTNTGLLRCSKSCRLRWTNYLRPGIRRGDFTDDEEKMIISLQALLGNKWAAIASYLPERTDNDIKNYWNTHLKKKLKKLQMGVSASAGGGDPENRHDAVLSKNSAGLSSTSSSSSSHYISRGQWEKRLQTDINLAKQALNEALSLDKPSNFSSLLFDSPDQFFVKPPQAPASIIHPTTATTATTYASSTENIAKLLKGFMKNTPPKRSSSVASANPQAVKSEVNSNSACCNSTNSSVDDGDKTNGIDLSEALESLFGFESFDSNSNNNSDFSHQSNYTSPEASNLFQGESKTPPLQLAMFENWLLEEAAVGAACHVHVKSDHLTTNFSFDESAADFFED